MSAIYVIYIIDIHILAYAKVSSFDSIGFMFLAGFCTRFVSYLFLESDYYSYLCRSIHD